MLNNSSQWLTLRSADDRSSTLRPEARSVDANTARSSLDHHSSTKPRTSGLERLKQGAIPTRSLTALSTPHDRVLEKMYYHPRKSEGALPLPSELDANHPPLNRDHSQTGAIHHVEANTNENTGSRTLNEPANSREGAVSATPTTSFASNILPATRLYDPFDGAPLGIIVPAETTTRGDSMPVHVEGNSNEELWAHLSRVLDLQHQIARMHVDMEGAGPGKQTDGKGKGSLGNPPRSAFTRPRTTSTGSMHGAEIEDEEGVGVVDEESEKLKAREREFKKLATQFEGRKETINEMMSKVVCHPVHFTSAMILMSSTSSSMISPRHLQNFTPFKLLRSNSQARPVITHSAKALTTNLKCLPSSHQALLHLLSAPVILAFSLPPCPCTFPPLTSSHPSLGGNYFPFPVQAPSFSLLL